MAGTSYTRQSTLTDGDTITASLFNAEYNQLVTAFSYAASGTTGHQHDGGAGEGGNIEIIGDQDFNNKIVVDSSNNRWSVYVEVGGSAVEQVRIEDGVVYPVTDSDVDLGTNALRFKDAYIDSLTATGNLTIGGNIDVDGTIEFDGLSGTGSVTVTDILDQDDMSGNSATALATQQSIKAYVDAQQDTVDTFGEVLALSNTTAGTDISVSTDDKVQFRDSAIYINSSADGQLDIVADTEIQIAATTVDINGAINASGEIIAASLDISGNIDVDGVTNLDVVDIDGAVDMASTLTVASNIVVGGTVDGRDVATDGSKLDGIEASATADQTNAEIRTAVEAATDSNVFTDADHTKLNAIEASADVTDTANVTSAGALMDSELTAIASVKALNQGVATTDSPTFAAVTVNGNVEFDGLSGTGSVTVTDILDQDDMSGNSATALATQQSIKAYVDAQQDTVDTLAEILALSNATGGSNIVFGDSSGATDDRLVFGSGSDLQIYHNGSHSIIDEAGTGDLFLRSTNGDAVLIYAGGTTSSKKRLAAKSTGEVELYYGSTARLATTSGGISVTGEVAATSLDISGDIDVDGTANLDGFTSVGNGTITGDLVIQETGFPRITLQDLDGTNTRSFIDHTGSDLIFTAQNNTAHGRIIFNRYNNSSTVTSGYFDAAGKLFINGDIDVDGTSNLDVVDIDGAVDMASTLAVGGVVTANAGVVVDNITIDGDEINVGSGNLVLDVASEIHLDADSGIIRFRDDGGDIGMFRNESQDFTIRSMVADKDMLFKGQDGSSTITALTLDMSAAGAATFNSSITIPDWVYHSGDSNTYFGFPSGDEFKIVTGNTGRLHIKGSESVWNEGGEDKDFRVESDTNTHMLFVDGGNNRVGVGSGTTSRLLTVSAPSGDTPVNITTTTSGSFLEFTDTNTTSGRSPLVGVIGDNLVFYTNAGSYSEKFRIASDGSLSTPTAGNSNVRFGVNAGNSIASGGNYNVVVGDEAGTALTTGDQNIAIGFEALSTATTASRNTAVGLQALKVNTGDDNSAFGYGALISNTTGTYNTTIGRSAGFSVTTGVQNTLIGALAGDALTDADYNVAMGTSTLSSDTKGNRAVAIGTYALFSQNFTSSTDNYNVAVGYAAGNVITTGFDNTLIGGLAGDSLTDADYNVAIGKEALSDDTLGSRSTAVGWSALANQNFTSATNSYNTAMGFQAGLSVTTGVQNTLIGALAGDALTDADFNVAIGASALSADTLGNSSIAIGYNALRSQNFTSATNSQNTVIGHNAGQAVTTGEANVFVGQLVGADQTTGGYNVALGTASLRLNTVASQNVAIGHNALYNLEPSSAANTLNTAVGYYSGRSVTTGVENTLIGGLAGDALTDADRNTAVGYLALSSDTLGSNSVAIGRNALSTQNLTSATDAYNTAVGLNAGNLVTTGVRNTLIGGLAGDALTDADFNVVLGFGALSTDTLGSKSVAIGSEALHSQNFTSATDSFNTAVGVNAGYAVSTGVSNTLIGGLAGDALTTGGYNTATGWNALGTATTPSNNSAFGNSALKLTTTGTDNTAVGSGASFENTTGSGNTSVGKNALNLNTTASNNTAVGKDAGGDITTGIQNTVVGASAGAISTGANNTAIGIFSSGGAVSTGNNNTGLGYATLYEVTSGSNNTAIGMDAGRAGSPSGSITTASNIIVLGDDAVANAHIQVDWTVASDQRDKTDFTALDLGLEFVKDLQPVTYKWDKRSKYGDKTADDYDLNAQTPDGTHKENWLDIGFKAQEVEALEIAAGYNKDNNTNLVSSHTGDGKQMGLQYSKFVPILVKAIQEQQALIESLTARIETLEG